MTLQLNGRMQAALMRFKPLFTLAAVYLALGLALRLVLWWAFGHTQDVHAGALFWILPGGLLLDAVQSLYLLAPFALFLWLMPDRWYRTRFTRGLLLTGSAVWLFGLTFLAAVEYFFFEEFDARLNLVSVDYLMYPTEVIGDIRSEYPVGTLLIAAAAIALVLVALLRRRLRAGTAVPSSFFRQRSLVFAAFACVLGLAIAMVDSHSLAPSTNRVANELAANGVGTFFRALRTNEIDYHTYYASRDPHQNMRNLTAQLALGGGRFTQLKEGRINRAFAGNPNGLGKLNVVVVVSESFGAEFSRLYGSERDWTPQFDALARNSLWFSHMYASGTRTVRGLEAITASFPPIPSVSIVRRPGNENIANWGQVMRENGYSTSFLYGGFSYFDNMKYFYSQNGFEVYDRANVPKPVRFENIWGVSDEDLFDMALRQFDDRARTGQPFFSIIMTTSNHKPFTFRDGVPGVKPTGGGRESGVRYADFAQGQFVRAAAARPWFDNTLFIIVADHGARVYGRADIPLKSYEIPMLFHAPRHLRPGLVSQLTTQVDIAPTVLAMLGLPYDAPFFGQDALSMPTADRVAFFSHNHDVALYHNGVLSILGLEKSVHNLLYDPQADTYKPAGPQPVLNDLAVAYYQTAFELFRSRSYR